MTDARPSDGVELEEWSSPRGGAGSSTNSPMGSLTDDGLGDTPRTSEREPTDAHVSINADAGDEARREADVPLSGINDDGYFGDEDGTWLPNDRVPLVLRQQREEIRATTDVRGDWVELFERFGWLIAASAFCVLLLVFALDKFSGANNKHKP